MYYSYTVMGKTKLSLTIDDKTLSEELDAIIDSFGQTFSYLQLVETMKYNAQANGWFKKEPYTEYAQIDFTDEDYRRITILLWKKNWGRSLMLEFHQNEYVSRRPNDYLLSKI